MLEYIHLGLKWDSQEVSLDIEDYELMLRSLKQL